MIAGMRYRTSSYAEGVFDEYLFEKNLQGDVIAVYSASGTKLVSYLYDAWGEVTTTYHNGGVNTSAKYNPFRYRGYYYDEDTGFYYLNSRYYDPAVGRFISADGYVSTGQGIIGNNMFAYCNNNPVMYVDSNGDFPMLIFVISVILIGTFALDHYLAQNPLENGQLIQDNDDNAMNDKILFAQGNGFESTNDQLTFFDIEAGVYSGRAEYENASISLINLFTYNAAANISMDGSLNFSSIASIYSMDGNFTFTLGKYNITMSAALHVGAVGGGLEYDRKSGKYTFILPSFGIVPKIGFDFD